MLNYLILGLLQGIFEWLPISSEGVMVLVATLLKMEIPAVDLALFLHLGTLWAVLIYFRKDWMRVASGQEKELLRFLIIATLISLVLGYLIYSLGHLVYNSIEGAVIGNALLLVTGLGLFVTSFLQRQDKKSGLSGDRLAVLVGCLQGLAVIPGFSRSGATIFGLSLGEVGPQEALKVSYMLSAPVVLASSIFLYLKNPVLAMESWPGLVVSFGAGLLSLRVLLELAGRINFSRFTLIFGLLCLLAGLLGFLL